VINRTLHSVLSGVEMAGTSCHSSEMGELFPDKSRRGNAECPENLPKNTTLKSQKDTAPPQPDQVMLINAALSAGMKHIVCVPAGVSVSEPWGKKLPSGFTVAPWMVTPEVAARLAPVIVCSVAN
jgi:hypothetical protein